MLTGRVQHNRASDDVKEWKALTSNPDAMIAPVSACLPCASGNVAMKLSMGLASMCQALMPMLPVGLGQQHSVDEYML